MMPGPARRSLACVPIGTEGRFEVLYWSLWKDRWASTGSFGRTVLSIHAALQFIAHEDIFWVMT
jgi:hypothetical protein